MDFVTTTDALAAAYGAAKQASLDKVVTEITPRYAEWIGKSRFCILSTVGPEGTDASPRGDRGPVVMIHDPATLWLPDWRGNNRTDSLANIVRDPRASLLFMVPGSTNVVRVNGRARVTFDADARARFDRAGRQPRSVIVMTVGEVYFQCAKALMRSELWSADRPEVPTAGDFIRERDAGFDAEAYDAGYAADAEARMW